MADGGGPTEQDRSEGMPSHSEAPYVRGAGAWLLSAGPRRLFQVTRRKGGTNSRRYQKNGYVPNPKLCLIAGLLSAAKCMSQIPDSCRLHECSSPAEHITHCFTSKLFELKNRHDKCSRTGSDFGLETDSAPPNDYLRDSTMNAIDLLKADHERVKGILTQLSETTERGVKKRTELLAKLEMEIAIHTRLEEEVLYPAFKKAGGKEQEVMYYEAKEEHRTVDSLVLPDLKVTDPSTPEFAGRVKVVKELLEHHIEEEETEMFPQAKKLLGNATLEELGAQMETLKVQYKKELSASNMAA
jgi:hemerythrin superfamily protein